MRTVIALFVIGAAFLGATIGAAAQVEPGRLFAAHWYYYTRQDGNRFGGTRFIAATHFRL